MIFISLLHLFSSLPRVFAGRSLFLCDELRELMTIASATWKNLSQKFPSERLSAFSCHVSIGPRGCCPPPSKPTRNYLVLWCSHCTSGEGSTLECCDLKYCRQINVYCNQSRALNKFRPWNDHSLSPRREVFRWHFSCYFLHPRAFSRIFGCYHDCIGDCRFSINGDNQEKPY